MGLNFIGRRSLSHLAYLGTIKVKFYRILVTCMIIERIACAQINLFLQQATLGIRGILTFL